MNYIEYLREYALKNNVEIAHEIKSVNDFFDIAHSLKCKGHNPEQVFSVMLHLYANALPMSEDAIKSLSESEIQFQQIIDSINARG